MWFILKLLNNVHFHICFSFESSAGIFLAWVATFLWLLWQIFHAHVSWTEESSMNCFNCLVSNKIVTFVAIYPNQLAIILCPTLLFSLLVHVHVHLQSLVELLLKSLFQPQSFARATLCLPAFLVITKFRILSWAVITNLLFILTAQLRLYLVFISRLETKASYACNWRPLKDR